jgi:ribosomal protein S12 methylthiotransferase
MEPVTIYLAPPACPKAVVDLEKMGWVFLQSGWGLVDEPAGATIAVVFGCGFIDILALADLKKRSELRHLIVVGCLPQKYGKALAGSIPEVDAFVGMSALSVLPTICSQILEGKLLARVWTDDLSVVGSLAHIPFRVFPVSSPWSRTVMISDGCDNACTYCAIPHMRGSLRSTDMVAVVGETAELIQQGAREIVLAAQDTASYGNDLGANGLAGLLAALAREFPETWLRLAYVNPDNLDDEVADVIAASKNICNYIDIPIQHASPRILKAMGRKGPAFKRRKIENLRKAVPDIALRTSVIVGFPGETEEDMRKLLRFLDAVEFDMAGVFAFSPQPGTPAAGLSDKVPEEVKEERIVDVVSLQDKISGRKMEAMLGREVTVLIEECDGPAMRIGRSQYDMAEVDRTIRVPQCKAAPGTFVRATLESVSAPFEWTARLRDPMPS